MIEKIILNEKLSAILVRNKFDISKGAEFITSDDQEFQIGLMKRERGYKIDAHFHKKIKRQIQNTSEALFIKTGKIRCTIFDTINSSNKKTFDIAAGDLLVIFNSAHEFTFIEDSEIIEIKQGPFIESKNRIDQ